MRIVYLAPFQLNVGESLLGFYCAPVSPQRGDFEAVPMIWSRCSR